MAPKKYKSAETINASDLENDSSSPNASPPPQPRAQKRKAPEQDAKPQKRKKTEKKPSKRRPPTPPSPTSSSSDSGEEEAHTSEDTNARPSPKQSDTSSDGAVTSSGSGSESSPTQSRTRKSSSLLARSSTEAQRQSISSREKAKDPVAESATASAPPLAPPNGFEKVTSTNAEHPARDLAGKQLWHIVCPTSVPLSTLTDLTQEQLLEGAKVKLSDGKRYTFQRSSSDGKGDTRLMIPKKGGRYRASDTVFEGTLSLQTIVQLNGEDQTPREKATKPVAQQPEGLKMRYHPPGFEPQRAPKPSTSAKQPKEPAKSQDKSAKKSKPKLPPPRASTPSSSASSGDESEPEQPTEKFKSVVLTPQKKLRAKSPTPKKSAKGSRKRTPSPTSSESESEESSSNGTSFQTASEEGSRKQEATKNGKAMVNGRKQSSLSLSSTAEASTPESEEASLDRVPKVNGSAHKTKSGPRNDKPPKTKASQSNAKSAINSDSIKPKASQSASQGRAKAQANVTAGKSSSQAKPATPKSNVKTEASESSSESEDEAESSSSSSSSAHTADMKSYISAAPGKKTVVSETESSSGDDSDDMRMLGLGANVKPIKKPAMNGR